MLCDAVDIAALLMGEHCSDRLPLVVGLPAERYVPLPGADFIRGDGRAIDPADIDVEEHAAFVSTTSCSHT